MGTGFFPLMKSGILFIKQTVSTEYSGSPAQNKPSGIPPPHTKKKKKKVGYSHLQQSLATNRLVVRLLQLTT